jgi:hypothetical protein
LKNLLEFYGLSDIECIKYFESIDEQVFEAIKNNFTKKTQEISSLAVDFFKNRFWYEENGEQKIWSKYDDSVIDSTYKQIRSEMLKVFDSFKYLKTFKHPLRCKKRIKILINYK